LQDLNERNITGQITRARLQHLQNWTWTIKNILDTEFKTTITFHQNLTANILHFLKTNDLYIKATQTYKLTIPLPQNNWTPIENHMTQE